MARFPFLLFLYLSTYHCNSWFTFHFPKTISIPSKNTHYRYFKCLVRNQHLLSWCSACCTEQVGLILSVLSLCKGLQSPPTNFREQRLGQWLYLGRSQAEPSPRSDGSHYLGWIISFIWTFGSVERWFLIPTVKLFYLDSKATIYSLILIIHGGYVNITLYFLQKVHHSLHVLTNTRYHLSTTAGGHFKQQNAEKSEKCETK